MTITFKNFLTEKKLPDAVKRTKEISEAEAISLAKTHCKNYLSLNKKPAMVRGIGGNDMTYAKVVPSMYERKSANTTNEYMALTTNIDSWKAYPSRAQSIICSNWTGRGYAEDFGSLFAVIPYDNAKIGVSPSLDFWNSFEHLEITFKHVGYFGIDDLDKFNWLIRGLIIKFTKVEVLPRVIPFNKLFALLKGVNTEMKKYVSNNTPKNTKVYTLSRYIVDNYKNIGWFLNDVLDPAKNNFILTDETGIAKYGYDHSRELWTDSTCLLIDVDKGYGGDSSLIEHKYAGFRKKVLA